MALDEFWYNTRRAAASVFRTDVYFADESQPTSEDIATRLRADVPRWFHASTVTGYRGSEGFIGSFLSEEEKKSLADAVTAFESAVSASDKDAGVVAFARILGVMNFYRYGDPDGFRWGKPIERCLRQRGWPDVLRELRFWRATHDDFLMLSIYAHLKADVVKDVPGFLEACRQLRPQLDDVAREVAPEWFPHVTFRTDDLLPEYANLPDEDEPESATRPEVGAAHLPGVA